MEHRKVIDEYDLQTGEFNRLGSFLKDRGFKVDNFPRSFRFEFTEANSILDTTKKDGETAYCGRIIDYPWGFENKSLHVFRGTRLEETIKEYLK